MTAASAAARHLMQDSLVTEVPRAAAARLSDFDFALPPELIAQQPAAQRDGARLLVVERGGPGLRHAAIAALPGLLRPGDLLIFNDVRVRPARIYGRSAGGGAIELLLLREVRPQAWECLARPGKRLRQDSVVRLPGDASAQVIERLPSGRVVVALRGVADVGAWLERHGEVPLPPYIKRPDGPLPFDRERYQTVFARQDGAVAAPTAGLHFSPALLEALDAAGVARAFVTLLVGPATFLPWREDRAGAGLEAEWSDIPDATVEAVARARASGGRVIAVGTTTTRALESCAARHGALTSGGGWADAFITPGFRFAVIDGLLTNFHLPRSTLLMLVAAFAGRERVLHAYAAAVRSGYRFYSYGDAMLLA